MPLQLNSGVRWGTTVGIMRASVLRDFFLGRATGSQLAADLVGTTVQTGVDTFQHRMADLDQDFTVEPAHLVRLCDAVLAGELAPERLQEVAFGMIASDHFLWDTDTPEGELVANVLYPWSAPEVNYALTPVTVAKFRHWLVSGENTLGREDTTGRRGRGSVTWRSGGTAR